MTYPPAVLENEAYLKSLGVWHEVSHNLRAMSCADAANKRKRLGNTGIPLFDELKSHVGVYDGADGCHYVVAHCRGHQLRDDAKLAAVIGHPLERLGADELVSVFGLQYGLVNPFFFARQANTLQIFDETVLQPYFTPHTMMTNIGNSEYGVEFDPRKLVRALQGVLVADIVTDDSRRAPVEHVLGILTGNGPESGIELWNRVNDAIRDDPRIRFRGDTSFPRVIVHSIPDMGLSMELPLREPEVRDTVLTGIEQLCLGGATTIGIACNTTQFFSQEVQEVCARRGAAFVSLVDETARNLEERGVDRFDLLGIGPVSDLDRWSDFRRIKDRFDIQVPPAADVRRITELAFELKKKKNPTGREVSTLSRLIDNATVTDTVLLALTELSLLVKQHPKVKDKSQKMFVDTLDPLATRMAAIYLDDRLSLERVRKRKEEEEDASALIELSDAELQLELVSLADDGGGPGEHRRRLFRHE